MGVLSLHRNFSCTEHSTSLTGTQHAAESPASVSRIVQHMRPHSRRTQIEQGTQHIRLDEPQRAGPGHHTLTKRLDDAIHAHSALLCIGRYEPVCKVPCNSEIKGVC